VVGGGREVIAERSRRGRGGGRPQGLGGAGGVLRERGVSGGRGFVVKAWGGLGGRGGG